jgi:hypothetical protein
LRFAFRGRDRPVIRVGQRRGARALCRADEDDVGERAWGPRLRPCAVFQGCGPPVPCASSDAVEDDVADRDRRRPAARRDRRRCEADGRRSCDRGSEAFREVVLRSVRIRARRAFGRCRTPVRTPGKLGLVSASRELQQQSTVRGDKTGDDGDGAGPHRESDVAAGIPWAHWRRNPLVMSAILNAWGL